jgi:zinc and cadmium transporter
LLGGIALFFILEKLVIWRHCHAADCETHTPGHGDHHDHGGHQHAHAAQSRAPGAMLLVGETIHNMLDGVLIAAAFLIDINLGVMTGLAVLAHEVPSEVGNFAVLLNSGLSRRQAFRWNLTAALGAVCGGIVGYFALSSLRPVLPYALAVSAASLLYVAVADLIPGLHRRVEPRSGVWQVLLIAAGVSLVASVEYFLPH